MHPSPLQGDRWLFFHSHAEGWQRRAAGSEPCRPQGVTAAGPDHSRTPARPAALPAALSLCGRRRAGRACAGTALGCHHGGVGKPGGTQDPDSCRAPLVLHALGQEPTRPRLPRAEARPLCPCAALAGHPAVLARAPGTAASRSPPRHRSPGRLSLLISRSQMDAGFREPCDLPFGGPAHPSPSEAQSPDVRGPFLLTLSCFLVPAISLK